jgi:hypothetical protein
MDEKADIIASKKGQTEEQKMKRAVTGKCSFANDIHVTA